MRKFVFAFFLLIIISSACSKKTTTVIVQANKVDVLTSKGLIYALPKVSLRVAVETEQTSVIAGPYAKFANKYLGLSNVPVESKSSWAISSVKILPYIQPDMSALFVVEPSADFNVDFLELSRHGLIIPSGQASFYGAENPLKPITPSLDTSVFTDLSPSAFIASEQTTHYSRVLQDSTYVRVPVHRSVVVEKSIEDKAREAADFIFSLRKRRFELISGDADFVVEGRAVDVVFNEINRLEAEYLSLFIGKKFQNTSVHWFDFTASASEGESTILFRFSAARGILPTSDLSGSPVLISVKPESEWADLSLFNSLSTEKDKPLTNTVYYRLPTPALVKIFDSKSEFLSQQLTFLQFGPLVRMPARFLISNKHIFFPKTEK